MELSPDLLSTLDQVDRFVQAWGCGPSLRQLQRALALAAPSVVRWRLMRLEELDLITAQRTGARGKIAPHTIQLTEKGRRALAAMKR